MSSYTSSIRVGSPLSGHYAIGDDFTDSLGTVFQCIKSGFPGTWAPIGPDTIRHTTAVNVGAVANPTYVSLVEYGAGEVHHTKFTVTALPLTISNAVAGTQASGLKIYDYPEGRILVLGATATMAETTTSVILSTLNGGSTAKFALGTTIGTNAAMSTTEVDHIPATSITSSATINVAGAAATAALAASAQFDGTATAKDLYLNFAVPTDGDLDADATITLTGVVEVTWILLGDL